MIPAGYMLKTVAKPKGFVSGAQVTDLYSLSECVSSRFIDPIETWRHNGFWLYDSVETIQDIVREGDLDLDGFVLFYYELYEQQFEGDEGQWTPVDSEADLPVNVVSPANKTFHGFDVTTHYNGVRPECSPLACNDFAAEMPVNEHCLLTSLDDAQSFLAAHRFGNGEVGPYRIFSVYTVDDGALRTP